MLSNLKFQLMNFANTHYIILTKIFVDKQIFVYFGN